MARPKNPKDIRQCPNCLKQFEIEKYMKNKFCSKKCSQIYTKKNNRDWLKKRDITNLEKYGVKSPLESKEILQTYKNNLIQKYGVDNPFLIESVKKKTKETVLQKYGCEFANQNDKIRAKLSKSLKGKVKDRTNFVNIKWEKIQNYCELENIEPLFDKDVLINNYLKDIKVKFKCKKCQTITEISINNGYLPTCYKCSHYKGYSVIEDEITRFIQNYYKGEIILKNRSLLSSFREIDIYLPQINLAFEINGIYWHSEIWGKYKNYHLNKTEECEKKDIRLIHIFDYEWIYKKEIVESMILNILNQTPNKIYARKCEIKEVDSKLKKEFLDNNHIQKNCSSSINLGLYHNNELVSIMTFGSNRFKKDNNTELLRFCNKLNTNVVGGASKLFNYFVKNYKYNNIISFADRRYSQGNLYYILGFKFDSFTSPSYFYWKNFQIFNRMSFQKHMLKNKLEKYDKDLSEYENMLKNGYNRVWDCGNYKFIY